MKTNFKMAKRIISIVLVLLMVLSIVPLNVGAFTLDFDSLGTHTGSGNNPPTDTATDGIVWEITGTSGDAKCGYTEHKHTNVCYRTTTYCAHNINGIHEDDVCYTIPAISDCVPCLNSSCTQEHRSGVGIVSVFNNNGVRTLKIADTSYPFLIETEKVLGKAIIQKFNSEQPNCTNFDIANNYRNMNWHINRTLICTHVCGEKCYDSSMVVCSYPVHTHKSSCYSNVTWTKYADTNNDGIADKNQKITVNWETNGGALSEGFSNPYTTTASSMSWTIMSGDLFAPTKAGYTFTGWYADEELTTTIKQKYLFAPVGEYTFYAGWALNVPVVSVEQNGHTLIGSCSHELSNVTLSYEWYKDGEKLENDSTTLKFNEVGSYTFKVTASDGAYTSTSSVDVDVTEEYFVDRVINWIIDGEVYATTEQPVGNVFVLPEAPTKESDVSCISYTFDGWYTALEGGEKVTAGTNYNVSDKTTYYAHFIKNVHHDKNKPYKNGFCENGCIQPAEDSDNDGYYEIGNAGQLFWFEQNINNGTLAKNTNAILTKNIDLENRDWTPICSTNLYYDTTTYADKGYTGTFDGNNKTISNMKITGSSTDDLSFGLVGTLSGTVKNVGIKNFNYTGAGKDSRVGAVVGQMLNGAVVENCAGVEVNINTLVNTTNGVAGGIAGCNYAGTIKNCLAYNITISAGRTGGIVSDNCGDISSTDRMGTLINCYTNNTVIRHADKAGNESNCAVKSVAQFASGEVAYLLQGEQTDKIWGLNIGVDEYPVLGGDKVYYGYETCTSTGKAYSNNICFDEVPVHNHKLGDVDFDGSVSVRDASTISKYLVGLVDLTSCQLSTADANGDGQVNISDATHIQKMIVGLV